MELHRFLREDRDEGIILRLIGDPEATLSPIGTSRTILPFALLALFVIAGAAGCSRAGDGSVAVQLVYPPPGAGAAASPASVRAASYPLDNTNRIRIRVLAPHFAPIEKWFLRSDGRGEIGGIPPGARIAVEVDEYPNAVVPSDNAAIFPLLGRGWHYGITLSAGEVKTVPVTMYAKGTIVTACGAPASVAGSGFPGDTGDGGLASAALLENPAAVKAGPDDAIYVSSSAVKKVKKIDRYGYLSNFAGNGLNGTITAGAPASSSPIGAVQDIDIDPAGNLYLFNDWSQIVRVDNGVVNYVEPAIGTPDSSARFNLAVVNVDLLYFVNYRDSLIYQMNGTSKSDFMTGYPLLKPSSIAYAPRMDSLVFANTDNNQVMRYSRLNGNIYGMIGDPGGRPFTDNIDASAMTLSRPRVVDYNPITGKIFFVDGSSNRVLYVDAVGKVHLLAGIGSMRFSGDGYPATAAELNDPLAITVDSRGNAYIADNGNHAIRMVVGGALP
jgi:hypothetical protein